MTKIFFLFFFCKPFFIFTAEDRPKSPPKSPKKETHERRQSSRLKRSSTSEIPRIKLSAAPGSRTSGTLPQLKAITEYPPFVDEEAIDINITEELARLSTYEERTTKKSSPSSSPERKDKQPSVVKRGSSGELERSSSSSEQSLTIKRGSSGELERSPSPSEQSLVIKRLSSGELERSPSPKQAAALKRLSSGELKSPSDLLPAIQRVSSGDLNVKFSREENLGALRGRLKRRSRSEDVPQLTQLQAITEDPNK